MLPKDEVCPGRRCALVIGKESLELPHLPPGGCQCLFLFCLDVRLRSRFIDLWWLALERLLDFSSFSKMAAANSHYWLLFFCCFIFLMMLFNKLTIVITAF